MQDPAPTAPDDQCSPNYPTTSLRFPARTVYRFNWTDALWLLGLGLLMRAFLIADAFIWLLPNPMVTTFHEGMAFTGFVGIALFSVCIALLGTSFASKVYAAITAVFGAFLCFTLGSWLFQAVLSLCFLWFFIDRFLLHGVDVRSTIPRTLAEQKTVHDALRNRWKFRLGQSIGMQHTLIPLSIFFILAGYVRLTAVDSDKLPDVDGPLSMLVVMLVTPLLIDLISPVWGGRFLGPSFIINEFAQAIKSWFWYDRVKTHNPVVHHSPAGTPAARTLIALSAALTISPLAIPRHFYRLELNPAGLEHLRKVERLSYEYERLQSERDPILDEQLRKTEAERNKKHWDKISAEREAQKEAEAQQKLDESLNPTLRNFLERNQPMQLATIAPPKSREERLEELREQSSGRRERIQTLTRDAQLHVPSQGMSGTQLKALRNLPYIVRFFVGLLIPFVTPPAMAFFCTARLFATLTARGYPLPVEAPLSTEDWNRVTEILRTCDHGKFRHDIFWGISTADNGPVIVPGKALREHVHFLGDSGSGKTSLGISPLIAQLMQFGDASVIVIDLKADDQTLFEVMREGARRNSQQPEGTQVDSADWSFPFRYFTPVEGRSSHGFNPFSQRAFRNLTALQKTDLLTTALGLQYGTDYGRKYFGDSNFSLLQAALQRSHQVPSFAGLKHLLQDKAALKISKKTIDDGSNVITSVERLATIEPLNRFTDGGDSGNHPAGLIDLADLFEKPQAVFFALPAGTGSLMSAEMARLVLFGLMNAAQRASKPRRQVYVIMDEFQRAVSGNIEVLLQMARSHDVSLILANQCLDDLRSPGADIASTVINNTRIRQFFGVSTPEDLRDLTYMSGERLLLPESRGISETDGIFGTVRSIITTLKPTPSAKLRVNDLIEASDHPNRSIFALKRGEGLAQFQGYPFIMQSCYHITPEEYERRRNLDWPVAAASTTWKRKPPAVRPTVDKSQNDIEATDELSESSEVIPQQNSDELSAETAIVEDLQAKSDAPGNSSDDIVWDGDRPIPAASGSTSGKSDRAADVDPQALKDILKTLDDFNF